MFKSWFYLRTKAELYLYSSHFPYELSFICDYVLNNFPLHWLKTDDFSEVFWWPCLEVYYWNILTLLSVIYEKCSWTCYPFLHSCKLLRIVATMQQFVFLQVSTLYIVISKPKKRRKKVSIKTGRREERRMSIHLFGLYDCCNWLCWWSSDCWAVCLCVLLKDWNTITTYMLKICIHTVVHFLYI